MITITPLVVFKGPFENGENSLFFPLLLAPNLSFCFFSFLPSIIPRSSISARTTAPSLYNSSSCGHYLLDCMIPLGYSLERVAFGNREQPARCIARPEHLQNSRSGAETVTAKLLRLK